jgi:hypothetical protein
MSLFDLLLKLPGGPWNAGAARNFRLPFVQLND